MRRKLVIVLLVLVGLAGGGLYQMSYLPAPVLFSGVLGGGRPVVNFSEAKSHAMQLAQIPSRVPSNAVVQGDVLSALTADVLAAHPVPPDIRFTNAFGELYALAHDGERSPVTVTLSGSIDDEGKAPGWDVNVGGEVVASLEAVSTYHDFMLALRAQLETS